MTTWGSVSVADIAALVPPGDAYVSYHWSPTRTVIAVISEKGLVAPPVVVEAKADEIGQDEIGRAGFDLMQTIWMRGDYRPEEELQRDVDLRISAFWPDQFQRFLYDKLVAPVTEQLAPFHTLVISPHARLSGSPFHAFVSPSGRALVEDHPVIYTDGAKALELFQGNRRGRLQTCFAAATGASYGGPPSAAEEAQLVAALFGTKARLATTEGVLAEAAQADLVHLACHTDVLGALSTKIGLALEDGTLTVSQVEQASFSASLVTLSACMTAAGDVNRMISTEEMAGMVGAFGRAGASTVVGTLWRSPDQVANPFMEAFYTFLVKSGQATAGPLAPPPTSEVTVAEALRQA